MMKVKLFLLACLLFSVVGCKETKQELETRVTNKIIYIKDNRDPNHPICFAYLFIMYGPSIATVPCKEVEQRIEDR